MGPKDVKEVLAARSSAMKSLNQAAQDELKAEEARDAAARTKKPEDIAKAKKLQEKADVSKLQAQKASDDANERVSSEAHGKPTDSLGEKGEKGSPRGATVEAKATGATVKAKAT